MTNLKRKQNEEKKGVLCCKMRKQLINEYQPVPITLYTWNTDEKHEVEEDRSKERARYRGRVTASTKGYRRESKSLSSPFGGLERFATRRGFGRKSGHGARGGFAFLKRSPSWHPAVNCDARRGAPAPSETLPDSTASVSPLVVRNWLPLGETQSIRTDAAIWFTVSTSTDLSPFAFATTRRDTVKNSTEFTAGRYPTSEDTVHFSTFNVLYGNVQFCDRRSRKLL